MLRKTAFAIAPLVLMLACTGDSPTEPPGPQMSKTARGGRAASPGVVYVRSQGLYFDTFVSAETLPPRGRFQKLEDGETDFGPGDRGYLGGRWWIDTNGNDVQDDSDTYLLCPLLGPGRETR